jgi:hypothetical protein
LNYELKYVELKEANLPIRIFIHNESRFTPEDAGLLTLAFEYTLRSLNGLKRTDTVAILIAKQIVAIAKNGERDPLKLSAKALAALGLKPGDKAESFNTKTKDRASQGVA